MPLDLPELIVPGLYLLMRALLVTVWQMKCHLCEGRLRHQHPVTGLLM